MCWLIGLAVVGAAVVIAVVLAILDLGKID